MNGYRVLSGTMLKWIAAVTMVIDHIGAVILKGYAAACLSQLSPETIRQMMIWYDWLRRIGRMAFPVFAFLLVEGFYHTRNRKGYALRLLAAAVCSEIPFDLALYGTLWYSKKQNVLLTLLIGFMVMCGIQLIKENEHKWQEWKRLLLSASVCAAGMMTAYFLKTDYSYKGVILILVFYFFYPEQIHAAIGGFCCFCWELWSFPSFFLLPLYNGKRGRMKGHIFYLFYPVHLLILYGALKFLTYMA